MRGHATGHPVALGSEPAVRVHKLRLKGLAELRLRVPAWTLRCSGDRTG